MKAIVVLRVSTESQEIDSQKAEMITFAGQCGYDEKDLIYVEAIGASAIKLDQKYMDMANRVKELILQGGIDCVFVWEISRLGRNEVILMDFKEFFIKHKVQFICKTPSLKLLDDNGSVNTGTELAFSLFATMSKQEMQEKKSRFARAKKANAAKGKYIGGHTIKFGYKVVDTYFVEDEEQSKVVKAIFDLYSTGAYSTYTLANELKERGMDVTDNLVNKTLQCRAYIGEATSESGMHYPQIISRDLFDRCEEIRKKNKLDMKRGQRIVLGAKLVKCPVCGATCTSNSKHFVCSRHVHHGPCDNGFALRQEVANDLLWRVAYVCHMDYLLSLDDAKKEQYRKELQIVKEKLDEACKKTEEFTAKKERIVEAFLDGLIDRKNRDLRLSKLQDDMRLHLDRVSSLQGKERAIAGMLEDHREDEVEKVLSAIQNLDHENKFEIIHRHISKLTGEPVSYGERDKRTHRPNAVKIVVTSVYGHEYRYMYFPKYYKGSNLYVFNGKTWVADYVSKVQ